MEGIKWYFISYHSQQLALHTENFFVETHYPFSFLMSLRFINSKDILHISTEKNNI